jgi:hypothetical protein
MESSGYSLDKIETSQHTNEEIAADDHASTYEFIGIWLCAEECEIYNPVENDLQLVHWSDSSSLVILVGLSGEYLGEEHADTD